MVFVIRNTGLIARDGAYGYIMIQLGPTKALYIRENEYNEFYYYERNIENFEELVKRQKEKMKEDPFLFAGDIKDEIAQKIIEKYREIQKKEEELRKLEEELRELYHELDSRIAHMRTR